jgi:hypothetical protein
MQTQYWLVVEVIPSSADASAGNNVMIQGPFTIDPPPDYAISATTVPPVDGFVGQQLSDAGAYDFTISNSGAAGSDPVSWSVYASVDTGLDASDTYLAGGLMPALGGGAFSTAIDIGSGVWPSDGRYYYLIYVVEADDDQNTFNNTHREGPIAVPYRYLTEHAENNDETGPVGPPYPDTLSNVSNLNTAVGGELDQGELVRIDGTGDDFAYDTFEFTIGNGVSAIATYATWSTGNDDLDILIWDEYGFEGTSIDIALDREPEVGFYRVSGWLPGDIAYVSASFLGLTTGYTLYIMGE